MGDRVHNNGTGMERVGTDSKGKYRHLGDWAAIGSLECGGGGD